ncbi:MAG: undecaprenyl/decaprenyl-phosphate alpha-N-acetylglucosaminyl 1-phosphate transferase [Gammaproteobacteria bacterium]|nr:undecaprenyl/decaprenyl-phosphate alpha-N-acetylglucosaminyl 1-phosphate transferase [Gammaproteobacteria bacterium]
MDPNELSFYILIAITSMVICMVITPIMIRIAPIIGMLDKPDGRKVHTAAIPRSGGVGIVVGMLVPLFLWLELDRFIISILIGCSILLFFGAWDDSRNIRPAFKFFGQLMAAIVVVYYGDIYVFHFPFIGLEELHPYVGKPFTVIAIVGMINALNLSDGLDGLAGGEALISLAAIAFLSYLYDATNGLAVAAATIGGIFGFLRFNSYPARIFMGDTGSQTLGFILGVMVVYISQQVNHTISPVITLLLLGLPVVDSIAVFYLRGKRGVSLVVAAKDHLHHRLLGLGFYHYETVIIIYSIQMIFVVGAVLLPYESDYLLIGLYLGSSILLFSIITIAERSSWSAHISNTVKPLFLSNVLDKNAHLAIIPYWVLELGISLFIVTAALMSNNIPVDLGVSSLILLILLLLVAVTSLFRIQLYRLIMFVTMGFSVYLVSTYPPVWLLDQISIVYIFFVLMAFSSFVVARITIADKFQITPLDYLVIIVVIIVGMLPGIDHGSSSMIGMAVQIIVLFYACELTIQHMKNRLNVLTGSAMLALGLIAIRGLV